MKRVGITGGIGSGKSTVVAEFKKLGIPAFVADSVAATYYDDPHFLAQLRDLFGNGIFHPDGSADKTAIARHVFSDTTALQALNQLIHPRVMDDYERFCHTHADAPYVLLESAILYDHGLDRQLDCVICVYLDLEERLQRLTERDHTSREALLARIANQMPAEETLLRADYVILNYEGNPRQRQVEYIDKLLRQ